MPNSASGEVVIALPYADAWWRVCAIVICAVSVLALGGAVYMFVTHTGPLPAGWLVVGVVMIAIASLAGDAARPRANEWRFDAHGWAASVPFTGKSVFVEWSTVRRVRLTSVQEFRGIQLQTDAGDFGFALGTVHPVNVGVFVDQLVGHLELQMIDAEVLALTTNLARQA